MNNKKVLIVSSVASMIQQFNMHNIQILINMGYEVNVACNFKHGNSCSLSSIERLKKDLEKINVNYFQIDFNRNIFNIVDLFKSLNQLIQLMKYNKYVFIHCHSPIGGVCGRIASIFTKTKVIYTAHGFHFYNGAPLKNWLIFFPVEFIMSFFTNTLITINTEDYKIAKKFHAKKIEYIPGVGIEIPTINMIENHKIRDELNIKKDEIFLLSVGELNTNKNHELIIKSLSTLNNYDFKYVICGIGDKEIYLKDLAKNYKVDDKVIFAGFRNDIEFFYEEADIFIFPSFREGLSVSLMEAMSYGLPVICSDIRGNRDLIDANNGGMLFDPYEENDALTCIKTLFENQKMLSKFGEYNKKKIKNFSIDVVNKRMKDIYISMEDENA